MIAVEVLWLVLLVYSATLVLQRATRRRPNPGFMDEDGQILVRNGTANHRRWTPQDVVVYSAEIASLRCGLRVEGYVAYDTLHGWNAVYRFDPFPKSGGLTEQQIVIWVTGDAAREFLRKPREFAEALAVEVWMRKSAESLAELNRKRQVAESLVQQRQAELGARQQLMAQMGMKNTIAEAMQAPADSISQAMQRSIGCGQQRDALQQAANLQHALLRQASLSTASLGLLPSGLFGPLK